MPKPTRKLIYQFKITLAGITPAIWRRIQVPETYTFWDLHVAIQDSMGWLDYHLHAFVLPSSTAAQPLVIGIPDDESTRIKTIAGWTVAIGDQFIRPGISLRYQYDFGDGWEHEVLLEGILLTQTRVKYPVCLDGARACPPEDCGGESGYAHLVEALQSPKHPQYEEIAEWLSKGHAKNYWPYKPAHFDAQEVHFSNPKKRWKMAFSRGTDK